MIPSSPSCRPLALATALALLLAHARGASRAADDFPPPAPREPSFADAAARWRPTQYACTILSPKHGRSKFATFFRGGVQTMYTSEVLGHCPLVPERAGLTEHFDQGIHVFFATGEPLDHRREPHPAIRQTLQDGYLPIMITRWGGGADGWSYEEVAYVRRMHERLGIERGDENAAAVLRLRAFNGHAAERRAKVRLCINGSANSQPRGIPALEYGGSLRPAGSRAVTSGGATRLLWKAPGGASIEPRFRGRVPQVLEWKAGSDEPVRHPRAAPEPPFNRYKATRLQESHAAYKAFDHLVWSYWQPETPMGEGTVGIGLDFHEPMLIRRATIRFEAERSPAAGGYRLEALAGDSWKVIPHRVNGRESEELKNHPEIQQKLGPVWTFDFEPTLGRALRIMIEAMPARRDRVAINSVDYHLSPEARPELAYESTRDPAGNYVDFSFPVGGGSHADVIVCVPFLPAGAEETRWLEGFDFDRERDRIAGSWEADLARGAKLDIPERKALDAWHANVIHMYTTAERVPESGFTITKTNLGWYEAVWASLTASQALALDERGYHAEAASYLEPFLAWQGTMDPQGEYKSREGFLSSTDEYTWVRWVSNHGWLLWALADHYLMSGDRPWLGRTLPNILAACDWIERERARTKTSGPAGERPPHWGLLPPGSTGDGAPNCYGFMSDAVTWRGLEAAVTVLEEIGHPRARELRAAADEYRQCILAGVSWAKENTPPYILKDGRSIPFIANDVYNVWKINTGHPDPNINRHFWWLDVGPLHLVDMGVLDARAELTGFLLEAAEDHWLEGNVTKAEPYYNPQRAIYLGRDDVDAFLEMFYTLLAEGMDRQTHVTAEYHHGVQTLPWCDAEHSRTQRMMLLREEGESILLAAAVPRAWLIHGQRVALERAPTYFGPLGFEIVSKVLDGRIEARVSPPARRPVPLRLRLRHPEGKRIRGVTVNGAAHTDFDGEWVRLPAGSVPLEIVAAY
jgi:hypothetical protein